VLLALAGLGRAQQWMVGLKAVFLVLTLLGHASLWLMYTSWHNSSKPSVCYGSMRRV
jgi:hypothetical protein